MADYYRQYSKHSQKVGPGVCSFGSVIALIPVISMIVMGAIHQDNCPAERYIPIYLIVFGCFSIILAVFRVIGTCMQDEEGKKPIVIEALSGLMSLFMFAWFIAGSVWIYRIYNTYNPDDVLASNYCHNSFYLFAFWMTTVSYILMALCLLICCCWCVVTCCDRESE